MHPPPLLLPHLEQQAARGAALQAAVFHQPRDEGVEVVVVGQGGPHHLRTGRSMVELPAVFCRIHTIVCCISANHRVKLTQSTIQSTSSPPGGHVW